MRKSLVAAFAALLLSTTAQAADKAGPPAVVEETTPLMKSYCYIEGSVAKNATATRASDQVDGAVTISTNGALAGVGLGCDVDVGKFFGGVFARYDLTNVSGTFGAIKTGQDNEWMVGARGGFKLNYNTRIYGLGGVAGTDLTYGDVKIKPEGFVYGLGIETDISTYNIPPIFAVGIEWDHIAWKKATEFETSIRPDTDVIRATLKVKLDLFK